MDKNLNFWLKELTKTLDTRLSRPWGKNESLDLDYNKLHELMEFIEEHQIQRFKYGELNIELFNKEKKD